MRAALLAATLVCAVGVTAPAVTSAAPAARPHAALALTPGSSAANRLVTAHLGATVLPAGQRATRIVIHWGDRSPATLVHALSATPSHRYARAGTYVVRMMVTSSTGTRFSTRRLERITLPALTWSGAQQLTGGHGEVYRGSCASAKACVAIDTRGEVAQYDGLHWSSPVSTGRLVDPVSISCPSTGLCAVASSTQVLFFDGAGWTTVVTDRDSDLQSVSCASTAYCVAVDGDGSAFPIVDGKVQEKVPLSGTGPDHAISCPSAGQCVMVDDAAAYTLKGNAWGPRTVIDPNDAVRSVSCATASFCVAVASGSTGGYAMRWDGVTWSPPTLVVRNDNAGGTTFGSTYLSSVACPTVALCTAVGTYATPTLLTDVAATFDGVSWSKPVTLTTTGFAMSVTCGAATMCAAFDGLYGNVFTYNGTRWSDAIETVPPDTARSLSCPVVGFCVTVTRDHEVTVMRNGRWGESKLIGSGFPMTAAACTSATDCIGIGGTEYVHWDGTGWSPPRPTPSARDLALIACGSPTFCIAADRFGNALTFDGTSWSLPAHADLDPPRPGAAQLTASFASLTCPGRTTCYAVSDSDEGTLLRFRPGGSSVDRHGLRLAAYTPIACGSATTCVAAGQLYDDGSVTTGILARTGSRHGDGTWVGAGPTSDVVLADACAGPTFCTFVDSRGRLATYDGRTVSAFTRPRTTIGRIVLVSCATPTWCVADDGQRAVLGRA